MSVVIIRTANDHDLPAVAKVHVRSWQTAYRGLLPDDALAALSISTREQQWRERLEAPGLDEQLWVAELDGEVVGFASIGPCRDHDAADNWGEVHAIYLDPSAWNAGIGRALFSSAVSRLEALGYRHLTLWVLEGNARARAFYERAGWSASPAKKVEERPGFELREVRYERVVSQVE